MSTWQASYVSMMAHSSSALRWHGGWMKMGGLRAVGFGLWVLNGTAPSATLPPPLPPPLHPQGLRGTCGAVM